MGHKLVVLFCVVILSMFGIGLDAGLHWTPLKAHYFDANVSSIAYSRNGSYSLLFVRYPDG